MRSPLALALLFSAALAAQAQLQPPSPQDIEELYVRGASVWPAAEADGTYKIKTGIKVAVELHARMSREERERMEYRRLWHPALSLKLVWSQREREIVDQLWLWDLSAAQNREVGVIGRRFPLQDGVHVFPIDDRTAKGQIYRLTVARGEVTLERRIQRDEYERLISTTVEALRGLRASHASASTRMREVGGDTYKAHFQPGARLNAALFKAGADSPFRVETVR